MKKALPVCFNIIFFTLLLAISSAAGAEENAAGEIFSGNGENVRVLLLPGKEAVLSGEISGRIEKITVDFGDSFKKDQDLISFDCEVNRAQLDKAKAELEEAVKIDEINAHLEEYQSISEADLAVSRGKKNRALAEVSLRMAMVENCSIRAPFSGSVVNIKAKEYEHVSSGQPLLEIIDNSRVELQMFVKSSWLVWLKKGQRFSVNIDETKASYSASVTSIGARVDPVSQTLEIRGKLDKVHPELLAGMSGTAYFQR